MTESTTDISNPSDAGSELITELITTARASARAGELTEAERLFEQALTRSRGVGDDALAGAIHLELGELHHRAGDRDAARASAVAAVEIFNRLGDSLARALAYGLLARVLRDEGAIGVAERRLREAVTMAKRVGGTVVASDLLRDLAEIARVDGRPRHAIRTLNEAHALIRPLSSERMSERALAEREAAIQSAYVDVARSWSAVVERRIGIGIGHASRVAAHVEQLGRALGLPPRERLSAVLGAHLHDVGKSVACVASGVGPGGEPADRGTLWRQHAQIGAKLVADLALPPQVASSVRHHHERWDGTGLPDGLAGEAIPLGARLIAVANAYDHLVVPPGEAPRVSPERACAELRRAEGAFDPAVLEALRAAPPAGAAEAATPAASSAGVSEDRARTGGRDAGRGASPERAVESVLLVDGDPGSRRALADLLASAEFDVAASRSDAGFFSMLAHATPQVVIIDLDLFDDARGVLRRLRESRRWSDVAVIAIVGDGDPRGVERALREGADDCVRRPFDHGVMLARIRRLAALRRALREARARTDYQELLLDIIRDISGSLDPKRIGDVLVSRVAKATGVGKCSLIFAEPNAATGRLVAAFDNPCARGLTVRLERYPEISWALAIDDLVLIEDVYEDPLLDEVRREWETAVNVRSSAVIPLVVDGEPVGVFFVRTTWDEPPLDRATVDFAVGVARAAGGALEYARLFERVSSELATAREEAALARTDPLTRLANRRALDARGKELFMRARTLGHPVSAIMIDVDRFKRINDACGHAVGDAVLRELGRMLAAECAEDGVAARYGGEEFCLILPETSMDRASRLGRVIAERARRLEHEDVPDEVTVAVSVGVAAYPSIEVDSLAELIAAADRALYRAKQAGGGHMQVARGD